MGETSSVRYEHAILQPDKAAITAVKAPAGAIPRIRELSNLTSLDLSGNADIKDFAFLAGLPRLEKLHLDGMGLTAIPSEIAKLQGLTTLFVGKNSITDFKLLGELPRLVDLGLEMAGFKKIPDEVLKLVGLKILGLNGNQIQSISELKKLTALEALYVANNALKQVPKELASLTKLRTLWIAQNYKLTNWDVVGQLGQLEQLVMSNAHAIPKLPAWIFALTKLRTLRLAIHWNAPADSLDGLASLGSLEDLEELVIDGASTKKLPAGTSALKKLRKLILKDNKHLADISALRDLPALRELDLASCAISTVPESFSTLKALETLDLSHNEKLASIPGLADLPALHTLTLYSELKALPNSLGTLTQLRVLKLSAKANNVDFLAKLTNLEELYLADCQFDALPAALSQLRDLTIFRDGKSRDDRYLVAFKKLESLSVTQASFTLPRIPSLKRLAIGRTESMNLAELVALPKLEELEIHRSDDLAKLPAEVAAAKGLKKLKLEFLESLTDLSALRDLPELRVLELSYCNKLTALPAHLASLERLEVVELDSLDAMKDLEVLGQLPELRVLELSSLDALVALPTSLARLRKLERVRFYSLDALKDISVLARVESLRRLEPEYIKAVPRKMLAEVQNAIAARLAAAKPAPKKAAKAAPRGRRK